MPQALQNPAAKAAVDKECEKWRISEWNLTKVRSKKEVIDEARTSGAAVHFASLMDMCHLKNAELEAKRQKYKGRFVLRGDIVKDAGRKFQIGNVSLYNVKKDYCFLCVDDIGWKENFVPIWKLLKQRSRFGRTNIFLGSCIFGLHSKTM